MAVYTVESLVSRRATLLTSQDWDDVVTDAIFVHGTPMIDDSADERLLRLAVETSRSGMSGPVVINGMTDADSQPGGQRLAYPGSDTFRKMLEGWGYYDYLMIAPSKHTAAECDALIALAREKGWVSVTVMSQPHHIMRCMQQMVFCLDRAGSDLKVHTKTLSAMKWQEVATKGVLNGVPFSGTLIDVHVREEFERTIKYADRDGTGYTPHATLEELIAYYERRDAV